MVDDALQHLVLVSLMAHDKILAINELYEDAGFHWTDFIVKLFGIYWIWKLPKLADKLKHMPEIKFGYFNGLFHYSFITYSM